MPRRPQNIGEVIFNALSAGAASFPGFQQQQLQNERQAETDSLNEIMAGLDAEFQKEQNRQFALKGEVLDGEVAEKVRLSNLSQTERAAERGAASATESLSEIEAFRAGSNVPLPFAPTLEGNLAGLRSTLKPGEGLDIGPFQLRGQGLTAFQEGSLAVDESNAQTRANVETRLSNAGVGGADLGPARLLLSRERFRSTQLGKAYSLSLDRRELLGKEAEAFKQRQTFFSKFITPEEIAADEARRLEIIELDSEMSAILAQFKADFLPAEGEGFSDDVFTAEDQAELDALEGLDALEN